MIPIPPTLCVPLATAPLQAAFKGEVYRHRHTAAQSRRQLRIRQQTFHQRGRPPTGFPRRLRSAPRPAAPHLARARDPCPGSSALPRSSGPRSQARGGPSRPPPADLPAEPYFGRWRCWPGQPCSGRQAIRAGRPEQLRPQGFPGRVRARDRGHASRAPLPSPHRPHLSFQSTPSSSPPFFARPRSFPQPGTFSGAWIADSVQSLWPRCSCLRCPARRCGRLSFLGPLLPSLSGVVFLAPCAPLGTATLPKCPIYLPPPTLPMRLCGSILTPRSSTG